MTNQRVIFGEVLFDVFASGKRLGGAPFNVACHLAGLGSAPLFVSRIGIDAEGEAVRTQLQHLGMDTAGLQTDPRLPTGQVVVHEGKRGHQFEILPDQAYDAIDCKLLAPLLPEKPNLLYHGTLALRGDSRTAWRYLCEQIPHRFVDINLRAPYWDVATLEEILPGAQTLKLNRDELDILSGLFGNPAKNIEQRLAKLAERFAIGEILLTLDKDGATYWSPEQYFQIPSDVETIVNTVGAGDAFSAAWLHARALGKSRRDALQFANRLAGVVCTLPGALPTDRQFYQTSRASTPAIDLG